MLFWFKQNYALLENWLKSRKTTQKPRTKCNISVPPGFCDSGPTEFIAESGTLSRIWKYAQNLAENDVFGLPTT